MPSSTSNSKERCPGGPWGRIWIVSLLITAALFGLAESFFRARGHHPSVHDDMALWSLHRYRIDLPGRKTPFVVAGASRIKAGFNPDVFTDRYRDYRLINLAVDGRSAVATLRDLAEDESFQGIVLYSYLDQFMQKNTWHGQEAYVNFYHQEMDFSTLIERSISGFLQSRLVLLHPFMRPDLILKHVIETKSLPKPFYIYTRFNRFHFADYSKLYGADFAEKAAERTRKSFLNLTIQPPEQWGKNLQEVETWIQQIRRRGGTVVILRMPSTGEGLELEEKAYPRALYWDRLAETTSAVTIHFLDYPSLSRFECPDTSHLDLRDAPKFTAALLDILEQKGILVQSERPPGP